MQRATSDYRSVTAGRLKMTAAHVLRRSWPLEAMRDVLFAGATRVGRGRYFVALDYPTTVENTPRWGHGRSPNQAVERVIAAGRATYVENLELIASLRDDLLAIPAAPGAPAEPFWLTGWLGGLDAASLYTFVRTRAPVRYVEIGSGSSTAFAARAIADGGLATTITSIDPSPRLEVSRLCDHVERRPLEQLDPALFAELGPGDIVFFDGSHRTFMNSDVTTFFLDVVPRLPAGVLIGVHDVFLPEDYPPEWAHRYYSEQYVLAALLLGGPLLQPVLPCWYASGDAELAAVAAPLWEDTRMRGVAPGGTAFWAVTDGRAGDGSG